MLFFFFNDTATTEIYTLSLHDALPISSSSSGLPVIPLAAPMPGSGTARGSVPSSVRTSRRLAAFSRRSEEHTSELQSRQYLVCRLLLEKKKTPTLRTPRHIQDILGTTH